MNDVGVESSPFNLTYHNFGGASYEDQVHNPENQKLTLERIKKDGMWVPVDYSILSTDINFWRGGESGVTLIFQTPHSITKELGEPSIHNPHTPALVRARLMDPMGEIVPYESDLIPDYIREIYEKDGISRERVLNGYRHIPPKDITAIIEWGQEIDNFHSLTQSVGDSFTNGSISEAEAVSHIREGVANLNLKMEIFNRYMSKADVVANIAISYITMRMRKEYEELIDQINLLSAGKYKDMNVYLARFNKNIEVTKVNTDNNDGLILDPRELKSMLFDRYFDLTACLKPSYKLTKKLKEYYDQQVFDLLVPPQ